MVCSSVPGSHLGGVPNLDAEVKMHPLPNERLLTAKAGDLCFLHCDTLHSTTVNIDAPVRYFISAYLTRNGLPHRDEFDAPAVHALLGKDFLGQRCSLLVCRLQRSLTRRRCLAQRRRGPRGTRGCFVFSARTQQA